MEKSHFIVILCGGSGPRLWPLSRADRPKQFLKLFSDRSLLQETYFRALKIVSKENIFLISQQKYASQIKKEISHPNLILEPEKKNTTLAILHATATIKKINPQAIISVFPSDHFIGKINLFKSQLSQAVSLANRQNTIVIFGIPPTSPDLSYGYFLPPHHFIEKPDIKTAIKLISRGAYWNSGIYTFTISTLEQEVSLLAPDYSQLYRKFLSSENIRQIYQLSPAIPIDKSISEKSKKLSLIKAEFSWNDIGEWRSIYSQLNQNLATLDKTNFLEINSQKCLLRAPSNKLIGLVGVQNLAVIDTPDALLICNIATDDSFRVRELVSQIVDNPKTKKYFLKSK